MTVITRTIEGFIDQDDFDSQALGQPPAGWTIGPQVDSDPGGTMEWEVLAAPPGMSGRALLGQLNISAGTAFAEQALTRDGTTAQDRVVQALVMNEQGGGGDNVQVSLHMRHQSESDWANVRLVHVLDVVRLVDRVANVNDSVDVTFNLQLNTVYALRVSVQGTALVARLLDPVTEALLVEATRSLQAVTSGLWGVRFIGAAKIIVGTPRRGEMWWDDWRLYSATTVICTGLPTGWQIQLKKSDESIVAGPKSEVGGEATIDYGGLFPLAKLEVLDESGTLEESISPANGIWGGDSYEVSEVKFEIWTSCATPPVAVWTK